MVMTLIEAAAPALDGIVQFVHLSLNICHRQEDVISLAKLFAICIDHRPEFDLKRFDLTNFAKALQIILPSASDLDFVDVLSAKRFLIVSFGIELSDELCIKIVKPSEKHMLSDTPEKRDTDTEADSSLLLAADLYEMAEDDIEADAPGDDAPASAGDSVLNHMQSLTPFYYLHRPVPDVLLCRTLIASFCCFSNVSNLTGGEAQQLLMKASRSISCFRCVLQFLIKMEMKVDLMKFMNHRFFGLGSLFPDIFRLMTYGLHSFKQLNSVQMGYVTKMIGDDFAGYVLSAKTRPAQLIAACLLRFDACYFAQEFLTIRKIKRQNLINLIFYIGSEKVSFPSDEFFSFLMSVQALTMDNEKKRPLSRRLLSVFLMESSRLIAQKALDLLSCDLSGPQSYDALTQMRSTDFLEIYYETVVIGRLTESEFVITCLMSLITPRTCYGLNLNLLFAPPTTEQLTQMVQSLIPSCQHVPFRYFAGRCQDPNGILAPQLEVLVSYKPLRTAKSDIVLLFFCHNFARFALKTSKLARQDKKSVLKFCMETLECPPESASFTQFLAVERLFLSLLGRRSAEVLAIVEATERLFQAQIVPLVATEILCHSTSVRATHDSRPMETLMPYLKSTKTYDSFLFAERAAQYAKSVRPRATDVLEILPIGKEFFETFCAIAWLARHHPKMKRLSVIGIFKPGHDRALRLLSDPKVRVFAPIFALLPPPADIPPLLAKLVEDVRRTL
jgi:hypothetical protein